MIFKCKSQKMMYTRIWEEIKKVINEVDEFSNYHKNYDIISFDIKFYNKYLFYNNYY